ncbi:HAD-IA family hydrolase [Neiella sp. HB171785]|uniref:HAD-IA family hydrolase n=1 Tax=Neiella litorisoli TaxID=2771431 RepID=A0A8J6QV78_9GAMM|nr:HAD-IA family hydrolase [Neiella litorisoli]MBD1391012.1 HAD-IA family hydrolase [Neiella litorisoli]
MTKAVLFDLDGTLLDTAPDLVTALNKVLTAVGEPVSDYEHVCDFASHGAIGLLRRALGDRLEQFDIAPLRQMLLDFYADDIASGTLVYPGIDSLINELDQRQIPWGIVTNKPAFLTDALLPHYPLFGQCKVVISGDTCGVAKPHPLPMTTAAEAIAMVPSEIIYVGDAERDMEAGNKVNMTTLLAKWGYIDVEDKIDDWGADGMVEHPTEILNWLK